VGPRAGLDAVVGEKFPAPTWTRTPEHPALVEVVYKAQQSLFIFNI